MVYWEPLVLAGLGAWVLFWAGAVVVYRAAPRRETNRLLALLLVFEGFHFASYFTLRILLKPYALDAAAIRAVEWAALLSLPFLYVAFLGTLDAPLSRPFRSRRVRKILVGVAGGMILAWPLLSPVIQGGAVLSSETSTPSQVHWFLPDRPPSDLVNGVYMLALVYGFGVALSAFRNAPAMTAARSQARAYLFAFGLRDIVVGSAFVYFSTSHTIDWPGWVTPVANWAIPLAGIAFVLLLGYGVLKTQLFDIELQIKRTVKQGTVVASLAGAYVLVSLGAKAFMSAEAAQTTGIVLTGLMLFALVPLQRFGGRVADAAMPGVRDDEAYLDQRRIEVYRAALEDGLGPDGPIQAAQEARLERLRGRLGLTDRDHALLLHAVRTSDPTTFTPIFEPGRTVLGRYKIEAVLGQGGQGTTYKALDTTLGREVVLKALHGTDPKTRFKEARALAAIQHPNVVAIHDVERVGDHVYLVMEHVDGGSLKDRLARGPLDEAAWQKLADDLLAGLEAVHGAGLVHRDVKPSNVLLTLDGTAKLADLGIATAATSSDQTTLGAGSTNARGTIAYMSPEQARGDKLTPGSDLFSAGVTLYEAYTGRRLFKLFPGESPVELQARVAGWGGFEEDVDDPGLKAWFARALAPAPEGRAPSAAMLVKALARTSAAEEEQEAV